jgi:NADP-dependent 3-hydroxy acid dehydrogenase YdfG
VPGFRLEGATAIVTGASRGIGRATARALAVRGARVVLAARGAEELEATAREVGGIAVPTDVTDPAQVEALVAAAGEVDVVVANAGVYVQRRVLETTRADLDASLATNFHGALAPVLAALPGMVERRRGHIVLLNSVDGLKGLPGDGPYVAAKHALAGMGGVLRQELAPHGIGVTSIFPGRVDTAMVEGLTVPRISRKIPPEAVAAAVVRGIERNRARIIVPRLAAGLVWAEYISPRLADAVVRVLRLEGRRV